MHLLESLVLRVWNILTFVKRFLLIALWRRRRLRLEIVRIRLVEVRLVLVVEGTMLRIALVVVTTLFVVLVGIVAVVVVGLALCVAGYICFALIFA